MLSPFSVQFVVRMGGKLKAYSCVSHISLERRAAGARALAK
jgi:hypothetical protein